MTCREKIEFLRTVKFYLENLKKVFKHDIDSKVIRFPRFQYNVIYNDYFLWNEDVLRLLSRISAMDPEEEELLMLQVRNISAWTTLILNNIAIVCNLMSCEPL